MLLRDTITRLRGIVGEGPHGEPVIDWAAPATAVYPAEVYGPQSNEEVAAAQRVEAQYVVQTYPDADLLPTDRVTWQGDTYEVVSEIEKLSKNGVVRSLKFLIKRWTGA